MKSVNDNLLNVCLFNLVHSRSKHVSFFSPWKNQIDFNIFFSVLHENNQLTTFLFLHDSVRKMEERLTKANKNQIILDIFSRNVETEIQSKQ